MLEKMSGGGGGWEDKLTIFRMTFIYIYIHTFFRFDLEDAYLLFWKLALSAQCLLLYLTQCTSVSLSTYLHY